MSRRTSRDEVFVLRSAAHHTRTESKMKMTRRIPLHKYANARCMSLVQCVDLGVLRPKPVFSRRQFHGLRSAMFDYELPDPKRGEPEY